MSWNQIGGYPEDDDLKILDVVSQGDKEEYIE